MFHCEAHLCSKRTICWRIDAKQLIFSQPVCASMGRGELVKEPVCRLFAVVQSRERGNSDRCSRNGKESALGRLLSSRKWVKGHPHTVATTKPHDSRFASRCHTCSSRLKPSSKTAEGLVLPWGRVGSVGFELASGSHVAKPESRSWILLSHAEEGLRREEQVWHLLAKRESCGLVVATV